MVGLKYTAHRIGELGSVNEQGRDDDISRLYSSIFPHQRSKKPKTPLECLTALSSFVHRTRNVPLPLEEILRCSTHTWYRCNLHGALYFMHISENHDITDPVCSSAPVFDTGHGVHGRHWVLFGPLSIDTSDIKTFLDIRAGHLPQEDQIKIVDRFAQLDTHRTIPYSHHPALLIRTRCDQTGTWNWFYLSGSRRTTIHSPDPNKSVVQWMLYNPLVGIYPHITSSSRVLHSYCGT